MPFYISPNTLKQQIKLVVKHWPFTAIKNHQARLILCQLYGYQNYHDFKKVLDDNQKLLTPICESVVSEHYLSWVKLLANLGSINQIQAKKLLHVLWPVYLEPHQYLAKKLYSCHISFHGACQDFLKESVVHYSFDDRPSIKDAIEAIGVPHPEVGGIQVNGQGVAFNYLLMDQDRIEVFDHPYPNGLTPFTPKRELVFLLDVHLARLARYLRMAGFNCLYEPKDIGDEQLAYLSACHDYILLTRDIGLLKRSGVNYGRWVRNTDAYEQFKEVVTHYKLNDKFKAFSRCAKCNGLIASIEKIEAKPLVPFDVFESQDQFSQCGECNQVYWKGSHYDKIKSILDTVV